MLLFVIFGHNLKNLDILCKQEPKYFKLVGIYQIIGIILSLICQQFFVLEKEFLRVFFSFQITEISGKICITLPAIFQFKSEAFDK